MATTMEHDSRLSSRLALALGILQVVAGAIALSMAVLTSIASVIYLGVLLIIVGIAEIVSSFRRRHAAPFLGYMLAGVLTIVVGALMLRSPLASLATLTLLVAGYFLASGLFRGVVAITGRYPHRGWDLAYAVLSIGLGVYVLATLPLSALWVVGTMVAIEIIARGATLIAASRVLHDVERGQAPQLAHA